MLQKPWEVKQGSVKEAEAQNEETLVYRFVIYCKFVASLLSFLRRNGTEKKSGSECLLLLFNSPSMRKFSSFIRNRYMLTSISKPFPKNS